jgi:hypothetical protein
LLAGVSKTRVLFPFFAYFSLGGRFGIGIMPVHTLVHYRACSSANKPEKTKFNFVFRKNEDTEKSENLINRTI